MRVLVREGEGKVVSLKVLDVPPGALGKVSGRWSIISDLDVTEVISMPASGGPKNIAARASKLAERHEAIDLEDAERVEAALGTSTPKVQRRKVAPPVNQADLLDDGDENPWTSRGASDDGESEGEDAPVVEEDEEDEELAALLDEDEEEDPEENDDTEPEEEEAAEAAPRRPWWPAEGEGSAPAASVESAPIENGKIDEADLDEKLMDLGWDPDVLDRLSLAEKVTRVEQKLHPPRWRQKHHRDPVASAKRREAIREEDARNGVEHPIRPLETVVVPPKVRGWRLWVWRRDWPLMTATDGSRVPRRFGVGDTPDEEEVHNIAARWVESGFDSAIEPLAYHHKAPRAKNTIWTRDPYEPILCQMPGCTWVGDHFSPHLRVHGIGIDAYRAATGYNGPIVVGLASQSLGSAHEAIRARNDIRAGQHIAEVHGTNDVDVWRVVRIYKSPDPESTPEKPRFTYSFLVQKLPKGQEVKLTAAELFQRFKPVNTWSHRILREMGIEKRRR